MSAHICTVYEGDYYFGLAALVNSLIAHGFTGTFWVGFRGELPPWCSSASKVAQGWKYTVEDKCTIYFVLVDSSRNLGHYKPEFMRTLMTEYCPEASAIFYFDPDIVVIRSWSFFESWISGGIAVCEDLLSPVNASSPIRQAWKKFFGERNFALTRDLDLYVNSGFVGLLRENMGLLDDWIKVQEIMFAEFPKMSQLKEGADDFIFRHTDQDALNVALMASQIPVSIAGKEGMSFNPGYARMMSHAVGFPKPWNRKCWTLKALKGNPPTIADRDYLRHVRAPIASYSSFKYRLRYLDWFLAKAIGMVFQRYF